MVFVYYIECALFTSSLIANIFVFTVFLYSHETYLALAVVEDRRCGLMFARLLGFIVGGAV